MSMAICVVARFALCVAVAIGSIYSQPTDAKAKSAHNGTDAALCAIVPDAWTRLGSQESTAEETATVMAITDKIKLKIVKSRISCPTGEMILFDKARAQFVNSLGFSKDGRYAAISGGWQADALAGGGGVCVYEKAPDGWRLYACFLTWVS